jgi:hypothetical protein
MIIENSDKVTFLRSLPRCDHLSSVEVGKCIGFSTNDFNTHMGSLRHFEIRAGEINGDSGDRKITIFVGYQPRGLR